MDNAQKKFFLFGGGSLVAGIVVFALVFKQGDNNNSSVESTEEIEVEQNSRYDERIRYARAQDNINPYITVNPGTIEADSLLIDNKVVVNPIKKEKQQKEKDFQNRMNGVYTNAQNSVNDLANTRGDQGITYYPVRRVQTQRDVESEPINHVTISEKERRKRAIEESFNISANSVVGSISAVIHTTQLINDGQMVMLRTVKEHPLGDIVIPRNTILYAKLTFSQNRALLNVESVKVKNNFYSIVLKGHGEDGNEGIPINIDLEKQEINSEVTEIAVDEVADVMSVAGTPGKILGNVTKSIARATNGSRQVRRIKLIDNQKVNFIIQN